MAKTSNLLIILIALLAFSCKDGGVKITESPDPFSPIPGQADAYENDNNADNNIDNATSLNNNGTRQQHTFHYKEDVDWLKFTVDEDQRVIIETFDLSVGNATIMEVFYQDTSNDIYKIWGSDTGVIGSIWLDAGLQKKPLSKGEIQCSTSFCKNQVDKKLKLHRNPADGKGKITFYVRLKIPPFKYKSTNTNEYFIRTIGSGEYLLAPPTNIIATRDQHSDRIEVKWNESSGATSYRVVRSIKKINITTPVLTCSTWPCDEGLFNLNSSDSEKLLTDKVQITTNYTFKDNNNTAANFTDDVDLTFSDGSKKTVSGSRYSDEGSWVKASTGIQMRCFNGTIIEDYTWTRNVTDYRIKLNSIQDTSDPESKLPFTNENPNYYIGTTTCSNLPGDSDSIDDPKIGNIYHYVVYACDDDLEFCVAQSNENEQANNDDAAGGGSIKLNIGRPLLEYASNNDSTGIWLNWRDVTSNKTPFSIEVINGGSGYKDIVTVNIANLGGGYGAIAKATVSNGAISALTLVSGGASYGTNVIVDPSSTTGGSGAIVEAIITGSTGVITGMTIVNGGSGFGDNTLIPVDLSNAIGGSCPNGLGTVTATSVSGKIVSIQGLPVGSGCSPTVTFSHPSGAGSATAYVNIQGKSISNIVLTSSGSSYGPILTVTGGGGSGASVIPIVTNEVITNVSVLSYGSGYTTAPTINITGGVGTGAVIVTSLAKKIMRYSIQRASSASGPFTEVECQIDNDSTTSKGLLLEKDEIGDGATSDVAKGKIYFYRVIAQQLPDTITCGAGENCSTINNRQNTSESGAGTGNDDNCALDTDYATAVVSESLPSNIVSGHLARLSNIGLTLVHASGLTSGIPDRTGYYRINNNKDEKLMTVIERSGTASDIIYNFTLQNANGTAKTVGTLCTEITGNVNFTCSNGAYSSVPATLLDDSNGEQIIVSSNQNATFPSGATKFLYGTNITPVAIENRAFSSQGFYDTKVSLKWASVTGATNYRVYRKEALAETTIPYIKVMYFGNGTQAKIKVTTTTLSTQVVGSTDTSSSFNIDLANEETNTVEEVVSFLNRQPGFSAGIFDRRYKVINATKIQTTSSIDDGYLNLKVFTSKGTSALVTLNALAQVPIFSNDLSNADVSTVLLATQAGTTYDDTTAVIGKTYYYTIVACDGSCGATDNVSNTFIASTGFQRDFSNAITSIDKIGTGTAADQDEFDFNDYIMANHVKELLGGAPLDVANYGQYVQDDNDRFPTDTATPLPSVTDANVFMTKIGSHNKHPAKDNGGYNTSGNVSGTVRPDTFLPCSFHYPCNDNGTNTTYVKWFGDPDIIYDINNSTGGDEPLNTSSLYFNSPLDQDWLWFFAQKKYYLYTDYAPYAAEYIATIADQGCLFNTIGGPGTDPQTNAKPCSSNLTSGLVSNNNVPGYPTRVFGKKYNISFESADNTINEIVVDFYFSWPVFQSYHANSGLPQLGGGTVDNFIITPSLNSAPFYSLRLVKGQGTNNVNVQPEVRLPSSFNMFTQRGIGMVDWPACDNGTFGTTSVKDSYIAGGPCILSPVCSQGASAGYFTQLSNGSSSCAKMPQTGLKMCDQEEFPGSPKGIYTYSSLSSASNPNACMPAPYYTDTANNFYKGNTCNNSDKTKCPPMAGHFILRVTSPNGELGNNVNIKIQELADPSPENSSFP